MASLTYQVRTVSLQSPEQQLSGEIPSLSSQGFSSPDKSGEAVCSLEQPVLCSGYRYLCQESLAAAFRGPRPSAAAAVTGSWRTRMTVNTAPVKEKRCVPVSKQAPA